MSNLNYLVSRVKREGVYAGWSEGHVRGKKRKLLKSRRNPSAWRALITKGLRPLAVALKNRKKRNGSL
jgi:hypothetical protein